MNVWDETTELGPLTMGICFGGWDSYHQHSIGILWNILSNPVWYEPASDLSVNELASISWRYSSHMILGAGGKWAVQKPYGGKPSKI